MLKRLLTAWLTRQVAQHGSVAAMAFGLISTLLGFPLAGEQINVLISAIAVIAYIWSQVRALFRPKPADVPTVTLRRPSSLAIAVLAVGALAGARARADEAVTFIWPAVTLGSDDVPLTPANAVDRYGIGCDHTEADVIAHESTSDYLYTESTSAFTLTHTFAPGDYACLLYAHNATGWSSRSNVLKFTVSLPPAVAREPKAPILSRQ